MAPGRNPQDWGQPCPTPAGCSFSAEPPWPPERHRHFSRTPRGQRRLGPLSHVGERPCAATRATFVLGPAEPRQSRASWPKRGGWAQGALSGHRLWAGRDGSHRPGVAAASRPRQPMSARATVRRDLPVTQGAIARGCGSLPQPALRLQQAVPAGRQPRGERGRPAVGVELWGSRAPPPPGGRGAADGPGPGAWRRSEAAGGPPGRGACRAVAVRAARRCLGRGPDGRLLLPCKTLPTPGQARTPQARRSQAPPDVGYGQGSNKATYGEALPSVCASRVCGGSTRLRSAGATRSAPGCWHVSPAPCVRPRRLWGASARECLEGAPRRGDGAASSCTPAPIGPGRTGVWRRPLPEQAPLRRGL